MVVGGGGSGGVGGIGGWVVGGGVGGGGGGGGGRLRGLSKEVVKQAPQVQFHIVLEGGLDKNTFFICRRPRRFVLYLFGSTVDAFVMCRQIFTCMCLGIQEMHVLR